MDVKQLMMQASALQKAGNAGAAEQCYRQIIAAQPAYDQAHHALAGLYQRAGMLDHAISCISSAIDIAPRKAVYFNFLGVCHLLRGDLQPAEAIFRHAIALDPQLADTYNNLGLVLLEQKRHDDAMPILARGLELAPLDYNLLCNLARLHRARDDTAQALALHERAHAARPTLADPLLDCAACLHQLNRHADALAVIEQVLARHPEHKAAALRQKAALQSIAGDTEGACSSFDLAFAAAPEAMDIVFARSQIRKVSAEEPFFAHLQQLATQVDKQHGRPKVQLCFALGKAHQDIGDIASAARHFAEGGNAVLQSVPYDEQHDMGLFAALKQHVNRTYFDSAERGNQRGSPSRRPIFILGMERSGTTLIEQMLASHPDVHAGGELKYLAQAISGLSLSDTVQLAAAGKEAFAPDATLQERAEYYLRKIAALPGSEGRPRITDKMPGNFMNVGFIHALFPEADIIHCRRDPIDNCISSYTTLFTEGTPWSFDLGAMGRRYRAYWDLMAHWRRVLPGRFLEVRYEEVIANTEQAARTLLDWCGLDWDERVMRFYETDRPVQTASVSQVRQPIYTSSLGRWKQWEAHIQPLLAEIGEIEKQYWGELER